MKVWNNPEGPGKWQVKAGGDWQDCSPQRYMD